MTEPGESGLEPEGGHEPGGVAPALFPIQLEDVHCAHLHGTRRARRDDDGDEPVPRIALFHTNLSDDRLRFRCRLEVEVMFPALEDETAELNALVQGHFLADGAISDELFESFIEYTPVVQLWPFARSYLAQVAGMLGVSIPLLPMLDVRPSEEVDAAVDADEADMGGNEHSPEGAAEGGA